MAIARQLMSFIDKFKIERNLEPQTMAIATKRSKHQDEVELERLISSTVKQMDDLEKVIKTRKEEEKKREEEKRGEEKKKRGEEKNKRGEEKKRRVKEKRDLVSKLKEVVKKRSKHLDEVELDRLISLILKQKEELEKAIKKKNEEEERRGEGERGEEKNRGEEETMDTKDATAKRKIDVDSEPKLKEIAKKSPKHPDKVELDRLISLKLKQEKDLENVTRRA